MTEFEKLFVYLDELGKLEYNWGSYMEEPISKRCLEAASQFLNTIGPSITSFPDISSSGVGDVIISFDNSWENDCYIDILFEPDVQAMVFWKKPNQAELIIPLVDIIDKLLLEISC